MRRQQPAKHLQPLVPEVCRPVEQTITLVRSYQLLTPLFGGSPDPTALDPTSFVRATGIRGQLRFWWRACYGGNYTTIAAMKADEDALWGKAHVKGEDGPQFHETIQLFITNLVGKVVPAFEYQDLGDRNQKKWKESAKDIPPYAAFPLQATNKELNSSQRPVSKSILANVAFDLNIQYPSFENKQFEREIHGALWAWETFGGIGGRTRRGFGSIGAMQKGQSDTDFLPANPSQVTSWIQKKCDDFHVSKNPAPGNTPCLASLVKASRTRMTLELENKPILGIIPYQKSAYIAWADMINRLKNFRQVQGNTPWPDTSAVKKIMPQNLNTFSINNPQEYAFPKASLGLPIIFHQAKMDKDLILQGPDEGRERFASPLILRLLYCQNQQYVGMALVLTNRELPAQRLMLFGQNNADKKGSKELGLVSADVPDNDARLREYLKDEDDVALAFMKRNFTN
ncbi:type III-B CRISPR module RAMP protein Cmr1 [Tengunoibacter tsumagoiensis]|uniref:Type III-B CRISPR module RAMP protein Cmr1 n=1 Tax=Tengunoibacter tsumagoiensis TaxID=2014871 RepID=A0A402A6C6_9CHLR|nr:type III-B CRISPR module RAMP protein Cmr1 [Tengunoibacter tsumagoiensis]GCE14565.1 type III-B CRISPR module RAMP protein Cmr1 [Tengunoibacter tsumagoiensis]